MILKQTFCEVPDLDRIIPVLLEHGLEHLPEHCRLSPGVPLKPMLAHPTRGVSEVLKRLKRQLSPASTNTMGRGHRSTFWKVGR